MELSYYPLTMEALDQADAEALCLFVSEDERPLIGLSGAEAAARLIVKRGLSARQAERLAKGFGRKRKLQAASLAKDADTVKQYVQAFTAVGCDELILFPCSPDPAQVDLLADAVA